MVRILIYWEFEFYNCGECVRMGQPDKLAADRSSSDL